jgi:molecular chaperone HscC
MPRASFDYEASPPLGIDLGTSNSTIARWVNTRGYSGGMVYNLNLGSDDDSRLLQSVVLAEETDGGEHLVVGRHAWRQRFQRPDRVAAAFKRRLGTQAHLCLGGRAFSPVELSAEVAKALLRECIAQGLRRPAGVVAAVPYHFTQPQKHDTRLAVERAIAHAFPGPAPADRPPLLELVPEPVAGTLAWALEHGAHPFDRLVLTVDLGGGTLDLVLLRVRAAAGAVSFEVLASDGSAGFGGEDFDDALEAHLVARAAISVAGLPAGAAALQRARLRAAVVDAKRTLSYAERTQVAFALADGSLVEAELTRGELESVLAGANPERRNFGAELDALVARCLKRAGATSGQVDLLYPIGGSWAIPYFRRRLAARFPHAAFAHDGDPVRLFCSVSVGAAAYAAYLLDRGAPPGAHRHLALARAIHLVTRTTHDLGVRLADGTLEVLVPASTVVSPEGPVARTREFRPVEFSGPGHDTVRVEAVEVWQGAPGLPVRVGRIPLPPLFAHGRGLGEVRVRVTFRVTATAVAVEVVVPRAEAAGGDVRLASDIHLELEG